MHTRTFDARVSCQARSGKTIAHNRFVSVDDIGRIFWHLCVRTTQRVRYGDNGVSYMVERLSTGTRGVVSLNEYLRFEQKPMRIRPSVDRRVVFDCSKNN